MHPVGLQKIMQLRDTGWNLFWAHLLMPEIVGQLSIECCFDGKLRQHPGKLVKISFGLVQ